jgi:hypothetical protein
MHRELSQSDDGKQGKDNPEYLSHVHFPFVALRSPVGTAGLRAEYAAVAAIVLRGRLHSVTCRRQAV